MAAKRKKRITIRKVKSGPANSEWFFKFVVTAFIFFGIMAYFYTVIFHR